MKKLIKLIRILTVLIYNLDRQDKIRTGSFDKLISLHGDFCNWVLG